MSDKAVKVGVAATLLPHIFCCGLPIVMGVAGLFAPEVAHIHIIPAWIEPWIFVFSALMLGWAWVMVVRRCRCGCHHCDGDHPHGREKVILMVVTVLFLVSVILHIAAH